MAYQRMEVVDHDPVQGIEGTIIRKAHYDNVQDGIEETQKAVSGIEKQIEQNTQEATAEEIKELVDKIFN